MRWRQAPRASLRGEPAQDVRSGRSARVKSVHQIPPFVAVTRTPARAGSPQLARVWTLPLGRLTTYISVAPNEIIATLMKISSGASRRASTLRALRSSGAGGNARVLIGTMTIALVVGPNSPNGMVPTFSTTGTRPQVSTSAALVTIGSARSVSRI